jgi:hypothetical protein
MAGLHTVRMAGLALAAGLVAAVANRTVTGRVERLNPASSSRVGARQSRWFSTTGQVLTTRLAQNTPYFGRFSLGQAA